jgi:hypothetical protein
MKQRMKCLEFDSVIIAGEDPNPQMERLYVGVSRARIGQGVVGHAALGDTWSAR